MPLDYRERTEIVTSLRSHKRIMHAIMIFPFIAIPILAVFGFYFNGSPYYDEVIIGSILSICLIVLIGVIFKNRDFGGYLFMIGMQGILVIPISLNIWTAVICYIFWIVMYYLVFVYIEKFSFETVLKMYHKGINIKDISVRTKRPEKTCAKIIENYHNVEKLFKEGKTIEEIRIALDISRSEVRRYIQTRYDLEHSY